MTIAEGTAAKSIISNWDRYFEPYFEECKQCGGRGDGHKGDNRYKYKEGHRNVHNLANPGGHRYGHKDGISSRNLTNAEHMTA